MGFGPDGPWFVRLTRISRGRLDDDNLRPALKSVRDALAGISVDIAFIGANGITVDRGLTTPDVDEARVKSAFVQKGRRVVALADHSKFGREDFAVIAPLHDVDAIITDTGLDSEMASDIVALGIEVRTA